MGGEGACLVLKSFDGVHITWSYKDCWTRAHFICESKQTTSEAKIEVLYQPALVLPMDNLTYGQEIEDLDHQLSEQLVSFPNKPVFQTELDKPSSFLGVKSSFMELKNDVEGVIHFQYGVTVALWIKAFTIEAGKKSVLLDFSENEDDKSLRIYLVKGTDINLVDNTVIVAEACNSDCSDILFIR